MSDILTTIRAAVSKTRGIIALLKATIAGIEAFTKSLETDLGQLPEEKMNAEEDKDKRKV